MSTTIYAFPYGYKNSANMSIPGIKNPITQIIKPTFGVILIGIIILLLRFHTLFLNYQDWDEAAMMSEAWAMTQGEVLYKDIYHVHPIFQFFIFIPFFKVLPPEWVPKAVKSFNIFLILLGALWIKDLFQNKKMSLEAYLGSVIFIFYLGYFQWAASSYGEFYTQFPILASLCIAFSSPTINKTKAFLVGLLWAGAIFIKQTAIFDVIPLFIFFYLPSRKNNLKTIGYLLAGGGTMFLLAMIYPLYNGAFWISLESMFFHNIHSYRSSDLNNIPIFLKLYTFGIRFFMLIKEWAEEVLNSPFKYLCLLVSLGYLFDKILFVKKRSKRKNQETINLFFLSTFWIISVFLGLTSIGRFYPHYFTQLALPLAILAPALFALINHTFLKKGLLFLTFTGTIFYSVKIYKSHNEPDLYYPKIVERSDYLSEQIKTMTKPHETIFLYKESSLDIYYLSQRKSPNGIYMYTDMDSAHTHDPEAEKKYQEALMNNKPAIILHGPQGGLFNSTLDNFMLLFLHRYYSPKRIRNVELFTLKASFES